VALAASVDVIVYMLPTYGKVPYLPTLRTSCVH